MDPKNFFAELKRRNVYKVAVAYAVVAWLLIQVATQVFPFFEIPNWAVRLVVLLLIIGFPVALILAWAFELTPEGIKRADTSTGEPPKNSGNQAWVYVAVTAGALSVGLFFLGRYTARQSVPVNVTTKSIAVLPFENLSEEKANAYFAEGIQEEILTRLAKIGALKVVSCTSTKQYAGRNANLSEIGRRLNVAYILEGSVQKADDKVRVNVQLIDAATDAHLWAEVYDRRLTDIFQVESEIAKTIAETLQAKLTGSEEHALALRPTENTEAHELYLKGRYFWNKRTGENLKKAISYFEQAVTLDPGYALAYAGLADAWVLSPAYGAGAPKECFPKAKAAAQKALKLDDTLAEAHASYGKVLWNNDFDFTGSIAEFKRAIELNSNYATAHHWYGNSPLACLGRFDEGIAEVKRAVELDPLSLIFNADLGVTYMLARRYDEAIAQLRKTLELDPTFSYAQSNLAVALELKGDWQGALAAFHKTRELENDPMALAFLAHAYARTGKNDEALRILDQLKKDSQQRYVAKYSMAIVELGLGHREEALRWLEESFADRESRNIAYIRVDPFFDPLRGDPRFEKLADRIFAAAKQKPERPVATP